jgi:hypothetical protein
MRVELCLGGLLFLGCVADEPPAPPSCETVCLQQVKAVYEVDASGYDTFKAWQCRNAEGGIIEVSLIEDCYPGCHAQCTESIGDIVE